MRFGLHLKQYRSAAVLFAAFGVAPALQSAQGASNASSSAAANNNAAVPVVTAVVAQKEMAIYRAGIGTVQAAQSVTVKVRVDGQLDKVAFKEGQDVKQGDLLAQIDPRTYQAQLNQAIAQQAHDQANLTAAQKDLERYTKLVTDGSIPQQTLDTQQSTVNQLKASVQSDQAQIESAKVQLSYTTIRAPISGRTGLRLIDVGNITHAADTTGLVVINQIDPIAVVFTLPEADFQAVNQALQQSGATALPVTALARDNGAPMGAGHLLLVNNQIDTSTGTFQLKALFPNPKHTLWPGQYVNVSVQIGILHNALTIPDAALQRGTDGMYVYVVKPDGSAAAQSVRITQSQAGMTVIAAGLTAGERVIVDGQFKVKQGTKVTEAPKEASKSTAQSATQQPGAQP